MKPDELPRRIKIAGTHANMVRRTALVDRLHRAFCYWHVGTFWHWQNKAPARMSQSDQPRCARGWRCMSGK